MQATEHKSRSVVGRAARFIAFLALGFLAGYLLLWSQDRSGFEISIRFPEGHGLKVGDALVLNGVDEGHVREIGVTEDLSGVVVVVGVTGPRRIASEGSKFWIPRFELEPSGVRGADTIVGAKYIRVIPGSGPFTDSFEGLASAPVLERSEPGDVQIEIFSTTTPGVGPGAPINWKGLEAGVVVSVAAAPDGSGVLTQALVRSFYAPLLRTGTVFYPESAFELEAGITSGFRFEAGSLDQILQGGLGFATPPANDGQGAAIEAGHRYTLELDKGDGYDEWKPGIALGASSESQQLATPKPTPVELTWESGRILKSENNRGGFALPVQGGVLAPADLLRPEADFDGDYQLRIGGDFVRTDAELSWESEPLALLPLTSASTAWPTARMQSVSVVPEQILIYGNRDLPLSLAGEQVTGEQWIIDNDALDESWHGAAVVDRSSGAVIGMLLHSKGDVRVARLPEDMSFLN